MIDKIINKIYETIENPEKWNELLKEIAEYCLGITGGGASIIPLNDKLEKFRFGSNSDKRADFLYYNEWRKKGPLNSIIDKNKNKDLYYVDDRYLSEKQVDFNPFYQDFLKKFGVRRINNIIFKTKNEESFLLSIQSPIDFNYLDREKVKLKMIEVVSIVKLALELSFSNSNKNNSNNLLINYLYNKNYYLLYLDCNNEIIQNEYNANDCERYGIIIRDRKIDFKSIEKKKKFINLLMESKKNKIDKFMKLNNEFNQNVLLRIIPFPKNESIIDINGYNASVCIMLTIEQLNKKTEYALKDFGLSPRQAQLSYLITEGLSIKEASLEMGISEGTARQIVKEAFSRLDINSQNKLVSFVKNISIIC